MANEGSNRNNFDLLRLILASMVMAGHFVHQTSASMHSFVFSYPNFAVEAFFVISGYLIYGSIIGSSALVPYFIRRACRIYPLYLVAVIVQAICMVMLLPADVHKYAMEIVKYLVANLGFGNFLSPDIAGLTATLPEPEINPSMWTLKIEVGFYIILPALAFLIRRYGIWTMSIVFVASSIYSATLIHAEHFQLARQLPGQLRYFVIGIALYHFRDQIRHSVWLAVLLTIIFFWISSVEGSEWIQVIRPIVVGAVVFLFGQRLPAFAVKRDISYGVYLIHGPVIQLGILLNWIAPTYTGLAMIWILVYALALLSERFIERPAIAFGKRFSRAAARFTETNRLAQWRRQIF
jgi:peptidoglycan/LPS O-acetylase OafA/YrhL